MAEDISIPARRYLRAWALSTDLVDKPTDDPRMQRILGIALPSTVEQNALECRFVEGLTWLQVAKGASTEAVAIDAYKRAAPHLDALDAAGEHAAADEAVRIINATATFQGLMDRLKP
jgi:hypothetical protein